MTKNFQDFPCNNCGWCCQRTPCPVGLYLGQTPLAPCDFLQEVSKNEFKCGLLLNEKDPIKSEALSNLLLAGQGCSHIYGPSPISLARELISRGLTPSHPHWKLARENTEKEYCEMMKDCSDSASIQKALEEFNNFCDQFELNSP